MTHRSFVHKGRRITFDIPGIPDREEDPRCEECRASGAAVCHHPASHAHAAHAHPSPTDRCDACRAAGLAACTHHMVPDDPHHDHAEHDHAEHDHAEHDAHGHGPAAKHGHEHDQKHAHDHPPSPPVHQHPDAPASPPHPPSPAHGHGGHSDIEITIDGRVFPGHINSKGQFHSHELPFMVFPTADALGRAIANKLDWSELHGREKKPEAAEES